MKQSLPIGISDFKEIVEGNYYFADKSLFIKEIIDRSKITLITRPRRFGKTMNLSMLKYFFDINENNSQLFKKLLIEEAGEKYMNQQGKYPVIFLSFKDIKAKKWEESYQMIGRIIRNLIEQFPYLRGWEGLNPSEEEQLEAIFQGKAAKLHNIFILETLSEVLARYYQTKTVILIDEYDTPIHTAFVNGYYEEMIGFMRDFLSGGFKDNSYLAQGVVTGILRIAKESIFSGFNNPDSSTILSQYMSHYFGFTEEEVVELVRGMNFPEKTMENIRQWYNGYVFGNTVVYNPWSIIQYVDKPHDGLKAYWVNTSDNALLKQLLFNDRINIKADLQNLLEGKSVRREVLENLVFKELEENVDAVWSLLVFSGYLKAENMVQEDLERIYELKIPNKEVQYIYRRFILEWIRSQSKVPTLDPMLEALLTGNVEVFESYFAQFVLDTFSFHDTPSTEAESFYHAFLLGLFVRLQREYIIKSNRESGLGRYDIMLAPKEPDKLGIIIEIKRPQKRKKHTLEDALSHAVTQIRKNKYALELQQLGIQKVLKLAIAVEGKEVLVEEVE